MLKIAEQPKIRFRSREGFCLASLGMHHAIKHAIGTALFAGIVVTPNVAFDYVRLPVSLDSMLTPHVVKNSVKSPSELQKIAAHVREWPSTTTSLGSSLKQEIGVTPSSTATENDDDTEVDEDETEEEKPLEIIGLDKVFYDYVMNTYVKRIHFR